MYRPNDPLWEHPYAFLVLVIIGVVALLTVRACRWGW